MHWGAPKTLLWVLRANKVQHPTPTAEISDKDKRQLPHVHCGSKHNCTKFLHLPWIELSLLSLSFRFDQELRLGNRLKSIFIKSRVDEPLTGNLSRFSKSNSQAYWHMSVWTSWTCSFWYMLEHGCIMSSSHRSCATLSVMASPSKAGCRVQKLIAVISEPVP